MKSPSEGDPDNPSPSPGNVPVSSDVIVVGSGVAGLSAVLELTRLAPRPDILLLTRGSLGGHGASPLAQGGVAAAIDPSDSPRLHAMDTEEAGAGLTSPELVEILTREGPARVRELVRLGARFDQAPSGELALGLEGAHSRRRILHAMGDRTGAEVTRALRDAVRKSEGVSILEQMEVRELLGEGAGGVSGVLARDVDGSLHHIRAGAVLLATGGAGRIYLHTTSPPGLSGDGLAMAARAGALVRDVEFMQFHPTALNVGRDPLPLVTEALRGAGARLVDRNGRPVLDPEEGDELAARDLVARAIWSRIRDGVPVFLDARESVGRDMVTRFPGVDHLCRTNGVNPATELIPVTPAAHYHMGGIAVDREGRSSIPGLWAAGEVAASGVHGANRLASNSLLEGLVFGPMAARSIVRALESPHSTPPTPAASGGQLESHHSEGAPLASQATLPEEVVTRIRTLLWEQVGLVRHEKGMRSALEELESLETTWAPTVPAPARSLLLVARLVTHAALLREESRGSHFRSDFPETESGPPRHSILRLARSPGHPRGLILGSLERDASRDRRSALQGSSEAIG